MRPFPFEKMVYGGDYYPEQWDRAVWEEDMRLFKKAGIDFLRINVFAWALNQPDEDTYRLEWLDDIFELLHRNGMKICLGTSTAAHPAWMATKYPDILRVEFDGRKRKFGGRHNSCPNSPTYRKFAERMASALAERYKDHPALVMWNVSNEFGGVCYCERCEQRFREWLQEKYTTLERLNEAWNTRFWGHTFYDWDEIVVPNLLSEHYTDQKTAFQGISLDYNRFNSDSLLECYRLEADAIKRIIPDAIVTTNIMGAYKTLDYFKWAKHMDVVAWDNYPSLDTPVSYTAMMHDLMRGLKDGEPFLLMEQTPSQQNWQPYNSLKRPGVMRLWSYQAIARGSDSVLFFQMRRSIGACEKFHGAVISHAGHEHTRVFRECAELGRELQELGDTTIRARTEAKVAIVFDWDNWWALEFSSGPSVALKYVDQVHQYYKALYEQNIQVDMIGTETNVNKYDIVIAPVLYMVSDDLAERLHAFVERGGTFVTTFLSGIVDDNDRVVLGGYPGKLRSLLGIWAEEIDALPPERYNEIVMNEPIGPLSGRYKCNLLFDLIHAETAQVRAVYGEDFYQGRPVLTEHRYGQGRAWYVATSPDEAFLRDFMAHLCQEKGIVPLLDAPPGVEVAERKKGGRTFLFILNHHPEEQEIDLPRKQWADLLDGNRTVTGKLSVPGHGVCILADPT